MRKIYLSLAILAVLGCVFIAYGKATVTDNLPEIPVIETRTDSANEVSSKGKVLIVYFTSPETDEVDTSSGASRLVSNGKLYGNTEYVATLISEETGGDLFQRKPVPSWQHILRTLLIMMLYLSAFRTGGMICRCLSIHSLMNMTLLVKPLYHSVRMEEAVFHKPKRPLLHWRKELRCGKGLPFPVIMSPIPKNPF